MCTRRSGDFGLAWAHSSRYTCRRNPSRSRPTPVAREDALWPIASFPGEKRQSRLAPVPAQTPRAVGAARVPAPRRSTWECTEHSTRRRDAQQRPAKRSSSGASPKPHQSGRSRRARAAPKALRLRAAPQGTQERFRTRGDVIPRRREAPGVGPRRPEALCRGPPPVLSAPCIRGAGGS